MSEPAGYPIRGDIRPLCVSASQLASQNCPARTWIDWHPGVRPDLADWQFRRAPWPFLLARVVQAATSPAAGPVPTTGLHPGAARYVEHAVEVYTEVLQVRCATLGEQLRPCDERVIETAGRRLQAWAPAYDTADRRLREVHRLRYGAARGTDAADLVWAAVAAKLAVDGTRTGSLRPDPDPERVLVLEVGLADGSVRTVLETDAAGARACYDEQARPLIAAGLASSEYRPGRCCGDCHWVAGCPEIARIPGLLGLTGPGVASQSVSMSDLTEHARCPAAYFLSRVLHLPRESGANEAVERGIAVHQWLADAHANPDGPVCTMDGLPPDETRRQFLAGHPAICPRAAGPGHSVEEMITERDVYAYDPVADVVVAARPDLVYRSADGRLLWRETKTTSGPAPADPRAALAAFPAAALDVLLLGGLSGGQGVVELEILRPGEAVLHRYRTDDPDTLRLAGAEVSRLAAAWHVDSVFATRPGPACATCPSRRWCPDRAD